MSDRDLIPRNAAISIVMRDRIKMNTSGTEFRVVSTQDHIEALRAIPAVVAIQPDQRDEVIEALVDALHAIELWDAARGYPISTRHRDTMRAALASAKAVQK